MKSLGKHAVVELYECDVDILNDVSLIEEILLGSVEASGATVVKPMFHKYSPHGVSGVIMISESHFSVHTWPEFGYAAVDIFTCGDLIDNSKAVKYLKEKLKAKNCSVMELKRGILDIPEEKLIHKPQVQQVIH